MNDTLTAFIDETRAGFGPIDSEQVASVRTRLERLLTDPAASAWLRALRDDARPTREIHRDPDRGFVLLAHVEPSGLYRPPHDHGASWVVYALAEGAMEIGTYGRVTDSDGRVRLVQREVSVLRPGEARAYLPGDVHDTRNGTDPALLFRFTARDLKTEEREGRLTRFVWRDGFWTPGTP